MVDAVKKVLINTFLVDKSHNASIDVHLLAASRLAIDFLHEGFKELEKYTEKVESGERDNENIGL